LTSKWIEVDPKAVNLPKTEKLDGVEVTVMMSPYDVPQALRGRYDDTSRRFVIEFRYLGEEETRDETHREHVVLRLGKNSGRLYGIVLDVDAMKASWVQLVLLALKEREEMRRRPLRHENYVLAGQLLQQNEPVLREAMTH
jgi:hypothetical protein